MLERAAVIGREFTVGAVSSLSEDEAVAATLLSLVRRDLIEPDRSLIPGDDGFRFRHVLIRDAAYAGLAKSSRAELHERYADWLDRVAESSARSSATTWSRRSATARSWGGGPRARHQRRRAPGRCGQAGRAARRFAGGRRASDPRDRASTGRSHRAPGASPGARHALIRTGDFPRADRVLTEALEAAHAAGDRRLELRTLIERELFRSFTREEESVDDIVAVADNAIPLLQELGDDLGLAKAWWLKSEVHVHACRWLARAENLGRALDYARAAGDRSEQSTLASQLAVALYNGPTPVDEAIERCEGLLVELPDDRSLRASVTALDRRPPGDAGRIRRSAPTSGSVARALHEELGHRFRIATRSMIAAEIESARRTVRGGDGDPRLGVRGASGDGGIERDVDGGRLPCRRVGHRKAQSRMPSASRR